MLVVKLLTRKWSIRFKKHKVISEPMINIFGTLILKRIEDIAYEPHNAHNQLFTLGFVVLYLLLRYASVNIEEHIIPLTLAILII
jgi:hypothetical protein